MVTIATQLPALAGSAHLMDTRASVFAPATIDREISVRGITMPTIDVRKRGGVRFVPGYRAADVHRSVAEGPPV